MHNQRTPHKYHVVISFFLAGLLFYLIAGVLTAGAANGDYTLEFDGDTAWVALTKIYSFSGWD